MAPCPIPAFQGVYPFPMHLLRKPLLLALAIGMTACEQTQLGRNLLPSRPLSYSRNYTRPEAKLPRRVAMLPLEFDQVVGETLRDIDEIFLMELGKKLRFEVVAITRPELAKIIRREHLSSTEPTPPELLTYLRSHYNADGVLFTEISSYRPYRPLTIGVRSKLVELQNMEILWSAETVMDAGNIDVSRAARLYAADQATNPNERSNESAHAAEMVLQSPRRFAGFTAYHLYGAIPKPTPVGLKVSETPPTGK